MTTTSAGTNYSYDGDGQRVWKTSHIFWLALSGAEGYGGGGEELEETSGSTLLGDYIFFDGERIAYLDSSGNIWAFFDDHLGSSRKEYEVASGGSTASESFDTDYTPFGREQHYYDNIPPSYRFSGKMLDEETGLNEFGARYYYSTIGRFMIADWSGTPEPVPYANLTNPQTLNQYAISRDNPETFADLDGHGYAMYNTPNPSYGMVGLEGDEYTFNGDVVDSELSFLIAEFPGLASTISAGLEMQSNAAEETQSNAGQQAGQRQQQNSTNATERATEAGEAALNFTLAAAKFKLGATLASTAETGAGAIATVYTLISALGSAMAGGFQAVGATTGKTDTTEKLAEVTSVATSAAGLFTLVVTKGNLNKAATAAAAEGIVTSNPADLAKGGTVERAAKAIDLMQNVHKVVQSIKNWF